MAAPSGLSLISPLRLWVVFNALFISLVASSSYTSYRMAALDNQKLVTSQVVTLTKSRFDDLKNRRFRDFVEGVGGEFGDLYVQVSMGEELFQFGKTPRSRHCGQVAYQLAGSGPDDRVRVTICRPFQFSVWPVLVVLAAYLLISGISLVFIRRLDRRATTTLAGFLKDSGVEVDASKGLIGIMSEIRDVRKQLDRAKERERALAGAQARSELAEQVAHDIRSPLTVLLQAVGSLSIPGADDNKLIRGSIARIRDIADDLLVKHRLGEAGGGPSDGGSPEVPAPADAVSLWPLIEDIYLEKRAELAEKPGVQLQLTPFDAPVKALAPVSASEFQRVLSNLINNAVEALNGGVGRVSIGLMAGDSRLVVRIEDDGRGIGPEIIATLGRRGETHGKDAGSGLGLYHAKTKIESWGGRLVLSSTLGRGTVVLLDLPRVRSETLDPAEIAISRDGHVVIVDDDVSVHGLWRRRLEGLRASGANFTTHHFLSPGEARRWIAANPRDAGAAIYLLDYEYKDIAENGLALAVELDCPQRCILVTGRADDSTLIKECRGRGLRIISKTLLPSVPLRIVEPSGDYAGRADAVLIDDDTLTRLNWNVAAKKAGKLLRSYISLGEFLKDSARIAKETPIYIDSRLSDGIKGTDVALEIYRQGYEEIYLATGESSRGDAPLAHIRSVIGKEPPWA